MSDEQIVADLETLVARLGDGAFYTDYDNDWRLVGVLRDHVAKLRAGWSLVRLDDCARGEVLLFQAADGSYQSAVFPIEGRHAFDDLLLRSTYALVPLPSPEDT